MRLYPNVDGAADSVVLALGLNLLIALLKDGTA